MKPLNRPATAFAKKPSVIATGIAISIMAAPLSFAQTTQPSEKIQVTGTRIPPKNIEGAAPITSVTAEEIAMDGFQNVENLLNNLPQVFADQGGNVSNGATGTATVNLRNLGANRTLVLVNGRRLPAGSTNSYAADLNQIPAPLIARVDVLTGGASGVYGSDAVAGVVNFIMNDNFQGVQFSTNNSFYNHTQGNSVASVVAKRALTNPAQFNVPGDVGSDGTSNGISMIMGSNFADGRGNATAYFGYVKTNAVLQAKRDYSACSLNASAAGV